MTTFKKTTNSFFVHAKYCGDLFSTIHYCQSNDTIIYMVYFKLINDNQKINKNYMQLFPAETCLLFN